MVQNVSNQAKGGYGSINRIGMTNNGRVVYQVNDPSGQQSVKLSVARQDSDKFEKSYHDIMRSAPKLQRYTETTPPEKMEKKQKAAKWLVFGCGALPGIFAALKCKPGGTAWGWVKTIGLTLLATGAGFVGGVFAASKMLTPPGAAEFAKATQTLSKLDIQPVEG